MMTSSMKLLNTIQQALKVPKAQYNSFSKFYYRNCEDIVEAVKPLLGEGVLILSDEIVQMGERYYVKATAELVDGEETVRATGYAREAFDKKGMDDAQITGAASSYARKYALNGLFCIDDTNDADREDNTKEPAKKEVKFKSTKEQVADLLKARSPMPLKTKEDFERFCADETQLELIEKNYSAIIEALTK